MIWCSFLILHQVYIVCNFRKIFFFLPCKNLKVFLISCNAFEELNIYHTLFIFDHETKYLDVCKKQDNNEV